MKALPILLLACSGIVQAQDEPTAPGAAPASTPANTPLNDEDSRDRVLYSDDTESLKPLVTKLTRNILMDQKDIWTSPFHMNRHDAIPWIVIGAATGALIAADRHIARQLPNTVDQVSISKDVSQLGAAYTIVPITAGLYIGGAIAHNPKARETGILGAEAAIDSLIVVTVLKGITQRPRPLEDNGKGSFFTGGDSFLSGHSMASWALASVVAHEYNKNILYPITAYGLASLVSFSRLSGQQHFASDIVAGSAIGWFIGRYVFQTHVDHSIHRRPPSKLSGLRPQVIPQFDPQTRTRGVTLSWARRDQR